MVDNFKDYPSVICLDCGNKYGKRKDKLLLSLSLEKCDICDQLTFCTDLSDFGNLDTEKCLWLGINIKE